MKHTIVVAVISSVLLLAACGSSTEVAQAPDTSAGSSSETTDTTAATDPAAPAVERYWILPETVECIGEAVQQCMQVAQSLDGEYLNFYDAIEGFTFEEGTSYVIDVEVTEVADPPADGSSLAYRLVEIIESSS